MNSATQTTYIKFLYCGDQLFSNAPWNVYKEFIWDPTEPIATRPLCFRQNRKASTFLMHDGNKNVTDVITVGHYDYAPFGAFTTASGSRATDNPFRFSSEYHDDTLGLVYYNYRHYNPIDGRWTTFDDEAYSFNLYLFLDNRPVYELDIQGRMYFRNSSEITWSDFQGPVPPLSERGIDIAMTVVASPVIRINPDFIDFSLAPSPNANCVCILASPTRVEYLFRFLEKKSLATQEAKSSWQVLAHERTHIDIYVNTYKIRPLSSVQTCAKTYEQAKNEALESLRGIRDEIQNVCWEKQEDRNDTFDKETNHGRDLEEEQEWEDVIYSEMHW